MVSIFFSNHAFSRNIILDCDVTLVGIEGKDKASNDTEVIDINLKAKTIFLVQKQFPIDWETNLEFTKEGISKETKEPSPLKIN